MTIQMIIIIIYNLPMENTRQLIVQNMPAPPLDEGNRPRIGRMTSAKLLGGRREIEIEHGLELYRLRVTTTGKLILTK